MSYRDQVLQSIFANMIRLAAPLCPKIWNDCTEHLDQLDRMNRLYSEMKWTKAMHVDFRRSWNKQSICSVLHFCTGIDTSFRWNMLAAALTVQSAVVRIANFLVVNVRIRLQRPIYIHNYLY